MKVSSRVPNSMQMNTLRTNLARHRVNCWLCVRGIEPSGSAATVLVTTISSLRPSGYNVGRVPY